MAELSTPMLMKYQAKPPAIRNVSKLCRTTKRRSKSRYGNLGPRYDVQSSSSYQQSDVHKFRKDIRKKSDDQTEI
eukprot:scaffold2782_cov88-Cylindrotheca_fusiformis.AAC.1